MLSKLRDLEQGKKVVQEYVHEFKEIVQQVGILSSRDRVYRLWHGFRPGIQWDLYSQKLNPYHSSWDDIVEGGNNILCVLRHIPVPSGLQAATRKCWPPA